MPEVLSPNRVRSPSLILFLLFTCFGTLRPSHNLFVATHPPSSPPPPWQLLGPKPHLFDIATDFAPGACADAFPDFKAEGEALDSLRKTLTVDSLMQFTDIDPVTNSCRLSDEVRISQIAGYHDARTGKTHPKQVLIEDAETGIQVRFSFLCGTYIIVPPVPTAPSARLESLPLEA